MPSAGDTASLAAVKLDNCKNAYVGGHYASVSGATLLDATSPHQATLPVTASQRQRFSVLAKVFGFNGAFGWNKVIRTTSTASGDENFATAVHAFGKPFGYATGGFQGVTDFDGLALTSANPGTNNLYVVKYAQCNGAFRWAYTASSLTSGPAELVATNITNDDFGNAIVVANAQALNPFIGGTLRLSPKFPDIHFDSLSAAVVFKLNSAVC